MRLYKCNDTGLMFEDINNTDNCLELSFCAIKGYTPKEHEEGLTEKHIPTFERKGNDLVVTIGSIPHPMTEDHYIEYVELETNKGFYRKSPIKDPVVTFKLEEGEEVLNIYAFCNIHGLWIKKGKEEKKRPPSMFPPAKSPKTVFSILKGRPIHAASLTAEKSTFPVTAAAT